MRSLRISRPGREKIAHGIHRGAELRLREVDAEAIVGAGKPNISRSVLSRVMSNSSGSFEDRWGSRLAPPQHEHLPLAYLSAPQYEVADGVAREPPGPPMPWRMISSTACGTRVRSAFTSSKTCGFWQQGHDGGDRLPIDVVSLPALTSPVTRLTISSLVIWSPMSWVS